MHLRGGLPLAQQQLQAVSSLWGGGSPSHTSARFPSVIRNGDCKGLLFGESKWSSDQQEIPDEISLLDAASEMLHGISTDELQRIFRSCIERLGNVTSAEGGYASS
jgi:hypothetical protein